MYLWLNLWVNMQLTYAYYIPYYAFLLNFFSFLILLGKFLSIWLTYYNILEWHDQLFTMWVCPYSNGA